MPVRAAHGERCWPRTVPTPCPVQRMHRSPYGRRTVLSVPVPYHFAPAVPVPFGPCRSRTDLSVTVPYCFARTGPVPFCPYLSCTVLPVPVPQRFARTGPVPFCLYRSRTVLPVPVPYRSRTAPYRFALMLPLIPLHRAGFSRRGCLN